MANTYPIQVGASHPGADGGIEMPFVGDGAEHPRRPSTLCTSPVVWALGKTRNEAVMNLRMLEEQL